ncbi:MAG: glutamate--tRNA ligase, partial [Spirochaetae bacterium HGW-Spirochaetae-10]
KEYIYTLEDAVPYLKEIFREKVEMDADAKAMAGTPEAKSVLEAFLALLDEKKPATPDEFGEAIKETGARSGQKGKGLFMPVRAAATGSLAGLELNVLFSLLGWQIVQERVRFSLDSL